MIRKMLLTTASAVLIPVFPAAAQAVTDPAASPSAADVDSGAATEVPAPGDAAKAHPDQDQAIVVTGVKRAAGDVLGGVSVMDTEALTHEARTSIGETLQK